ncbi:MAG: GGDEF domain-containing protein [Comamonas sp.]
MPTTAQPLHESYRLLIRFCALAACLVHLAFIPIFAGNGVYPLAVGNVLSVLAHTYAYWQSRPGGNVRAAADVIGLEVGLHAVAATLAIGWNSGFHYLMIPMVPVCMLSTTRPRTVRIGIALCIALVYIGLRLWSSAHPPFYRLPAELLQVLEYGCLATLFLAFITIAARYHDIIVEAHETLRREAFTDPLTGALNRRRLTQVACLTPTADTRSALLLCDLDHFKLVNDQYGHEVGDLVLQAFYRQLLECTRGGDHVCRWGGEEFLVLLPQTEMDVARSVAYRLRASVEQTPVPLPSGEPLFITVTVGLASLGPGEPLQAAVHRADEALYRGKAAGRNQVQDSTQEGTPPHAAQG